MRHRKQSKKQPSVFDLEIHGETKRGIVAIFLFLIGILGILSFFGRAGQVGNLFDNALAVIFGYDRFLFPLILIALGCFLIKPQLRLKLREWLGSILLFAIVNGTIHILTFDYIEGTNGAALGLGGGYLGWLLAYPLDKALGFWGGFFVLLALFIISLLLISHTFVVQTARMLHALSLWLVGLGVRAARGIKNIFTRKTRADAPHFEARELESVEAPPSEVFSENTEALIPSGENIILPVEPKAKRIPRPPIHIPLDLLSDKTTKPNAGDIKTNQLIIAKTLENFGIEVEMGDVSVGPTVTQYTLKPAEGVKLSKITALSNDLALALAAHPIRIEAPIPGKSLVGIEVPNQHVARVTLREVLESDEFKKSVSPLSVALGKDVAGKVWVADVSRMPHLLVAGSTGSGKTVCLNTMIVSLLYRNQPSDLKFILIDPKRVELPVYNGIPHLLTPVITEVAKTVNALRWSIAEMERRFDILAKTGKRDIGSYNTIAEERMPYIVIVIDELADLMVAAGSEVEASIIRLAQMARAVGMHLMIATQRPSVDVITGLIKANITSRVAFAVASQTDSRTILDSSGAEKLLGRGDMLFTSAELSKPKRLQGAFLADEEITKIVEFIKRSGEEAEYNEAITEKQLLGQGSSGAGGGFDDGDDPLFSDARDAVLRAGKASASLLQRRLKIGYARAARLLDIMEEKGIIGPGDGAKPREVLLRMDGSDTIDTVVDTVNFNG